jgi:hypothetical protein
MIGWWWQCNQSGGQIELSLISDYDRLVVAIQSNWFGWIDDIEYYTEPSFFQFRVSLLISKQ